MKKQYSLLLFCYLLFTTSLWAKDVQGQSKYKDYKDVFPQENTANIISLYYPNYLLFADQPAKFNLSYKIKVNYNDNAPNASGLYGAFSILGMWQLTDIGEYVSCPLIDINFQPEVFYLVDFRDTIPWFSFQFGLMHSSNAMGGHEVRNTVAWDQLYIENHFHILFNNNSALLIKLRNFIPLEIDDNPDILEYMGFSKLSMDYNMVIKETVGLQFGLELTKGLSLDWKGGALFNFAIGPFFVKESVVPLSFLFQVWTGYGETLRFYKTSYTKFRAGIKFDFL